MFNMRAPHKNFPSFNLLLNVRHFITNIDVNETSGRFLLLTFLK